MCIWWIYKCINFGVGRVLWRLLSLWPFFVTLYCSLRFSYISCLCFDDQVSCFLRTNRLWWAADARLLIFSFWGNGSNSWFLLSELGRVTGVLLMTWNAKRRLRFFVFSLHLYLFSGGHLVHTVNNSISCLLSILSCCLTFCCVYLPGLFFFCVVTLIFSLQVSFPGVLQV